MPIPTIYALNDFALVVTLKTVDLATGKVVPLTSGTVTVTLTTVSPGELSTVNLPGSATHLGVGKWLLFFDAPGLTPTLITGADGAPPIVRVEAPGALRFEIPCAYAVTRTVDAA